MHPLILPVLLVSMAYARNCTTATKKCPLGETNWKQRAQQFDCLNKNGKYTCLRDYKNRLVETCVETIEIRKGVVGCPFVIICNDNLALIGLDEEFHECPANMTGCPPHNHTGYALHEIYKYPTCSAVESFEADDNMGSNDIPRSKEWVPIVIPIICVALLCIAIGIVIYLRRKNITETQDGANDILLEEMDVNNSELREENTQEEIRRFGKEMKQVVKSEDAGKYAIELMEKIDDWKKEKVRIAIVGQSYVGKSSFINTLSGKRLAKIGLGNVTERANRYISLTMGGIEFYDISGYGTDLFQMNKAYFENVDIQLYDFVLLFYSTILTTLETEFLKNLEKQGKPYAVIKTRADDFMGESMKHETVEFWINAAKEKCNKIIHENVTNRDIPVFVISNTKPAVGELNDLVNFMKRNTDEKKRMNILTSLKWHTDSMIDEKQSVLLKRAQKVAVTMGVNAAQPIPGVDIVINTVLLISELKFYLKTFNLDEESLKEYPQDHVRQLKRCNKIINVGFAEFVNDSLTKIALVAIAGNIFEYAIPILGSIANGGITAYRMYTIMSDNIKALAIDAKELISRQAESLL